MTDKISPGSVEGQTIAAPVQQSVKFQSAQHELNAWRELGEEMARIISAMLPEEYANLCPDWFGPRLFDVQVGKFEAGTERSAPDQIELVANSLHDVAMIGWAPTVDAKRWAWDNETVLRAAIEQLAGGVAKGDPPEPVCDWFSARKAIDAGIAACYSEARNCERYHDLKMQESAESWRVSAKVMEAFIRQYDSKREPTDRRVPSSAEVTESRRRVTPHDTTQENK